jgi:hypothetical protein
MVKLLEELPGTYYWSVKLEPFCSVGKRNSHHACSQLEPRCVQGEKGNKDK